MENKTIIRLGKYVFVGSLAVVALLIIFAYPRDCNDDKTIVQSEEEGESIVYEDEEYDGSPFCNGMWDDPANCTSNVKSALLFASEMSLYSAYVWESGLKYLGEDSYLWRSRPGGYEGYCNFHKMVNFFKENPSHLAAFFETYERTFYHLISPRMYWGSDAPEIANMLIIAYNDLYRNSESDGRERSLAIYSVMRDERDWEYALNFISERSDGESLNHFRYDDGDLKVSQVVWTYSFWARREKEGNAQTAYNILKRIIRHYGAEQN